MQQFHSMRLSADRPADSSLRLSQFWMDHVQSGSSWLQMNAQDKNAVRSALPYFEGIAQTFKMLEIVHRIYFHPTLPRFQSFEICRSDNFV